jgi:hypothetical protein
MRSSEGQNENQNVRMELKYCEHCGGLWLRECGAGVVYCDNCRPKVADLPIPKRKTGRTILPVAKQSVVEAAFRNDGDGGEFEAAGGVA